MTEKLLHSNITEKIIQSFITTRKSLIQDLPENIYKNALAIEFEFNKLNVEQNKIISLNYRNKKVGELIADFLINEKIIVLAIKEKSIKQSTEDNAKL